MVSKVVVRSVLAAIAAVMLWTVWLTWLAPSRMNTAQKVALTVVESGVLLAALSLLVESFRSFGNISVNKKSFGYVFYGFSLLDESRGEKDVATARTCELFALRSVLLAFAGLVTAAFAAMLWSAAKFLLNPHALIINWSEVGKVVALIFGGSAVVIFLIAGHEFLHKKLEGKKLARYAVVSSYWLVSASLLFGLLMAFVPVPRLTSGMPLYLAILYFSGFALLFFSGLGAVIAIACGLFKLTGKAILSLSKRYPVLGEVWELVCPLQTIHFRK